MEMVGPRGSSNWGNVMRGGTRRFGFVRLRRLPDEGREVLRNASRRFVLHRPRPRQLGGRRRALCFLAFFGRGTLCEMIQTGSGVEGEIRFCFRFCVT